MLVAISVAAGLLGNRLRICLLRLAGPVMADALAGRVKAALHGWSYNKYFVDEIYDTAVVHPLVGGSREVLWKGVDAGAIDGR